MDITAAGSSVISVSRMTICIGTLSEAPFLPGEMPSRENGSVWAIAGRRQQRGTQSRTQEP